MIGVKNASKIKKVWDTITTTMVVVVVLLAILLVGVRLFGLQVYTVRSGSMEPDYPVGSLIYVRKVDYKTLKPDMVITYLLDGDTVSTHRIVQVLIDPEDPEVYRFITKGDANDDPDAVSVHCANIIGTPIFMIPYLGYLARYIQSPPGLYVAIAAGAVLLMLVFLPDLLEEDKKPKREAESNAPTQES